MKNMLALLVGAILLTGSASAQTADAAGTWDVSVNTPNGPIAALLVLKKDGEKLTGSIAAPQGEVAVEGTQKDKAVSVNFTVQTNNGPMAIVMTGTQDGDAIAGTTTVGEWSGKRRAGAPAGAATNGAAQADKPADVSGAWALQVDLGGNTVTPGGDLQAGGREAQRDLLLANAWGAASLPARSRVTTSPSVFRPRSTGTRSR